MTTAVPSWFLGAWQREWIQYPGRPPSEPRTVRDVQTPSVFGSVRIPRDRPALSHAASLADLTDAEFVALCDQNGFAGITTCAPGDIVTWHHHIAYQPPSGDDIGRLELAAPGHVHEHALDGSFVESWRALAGDGTGFLGLERYGSTHRVERLLAVAGDHFVFARNRAVDLPPAPSLAALVASTHATRETILAYLDCELSYGLVRGGAVPWEVRHSTLPWREGRAVVGLEELLPV